MGKSLKNSTATGGSVFRSLLQKIAWWATSLAHLSIFLATLSCSKVKPDPLPRKLRDEHDAEA